MNKKNILITFIVVVVGILGFVAYRQVAAKRTEAEKLPTETAVVQRGDLAITLDATGSLIPHVEVGLAFTDRGRVAEALVSEGDSVKAGEALVLLEKDEFEAAVTQAQAALDVSKANLQVARTQAERTYDAALATEASNRTASWTADAPPEIKQPAWYFDKAQMIASVQAEADAARAALENEQANLNAVLEAAGGQDLLATESRLADAQAAFIVATDVLDGANRSSDQDIKDQAQVIYDAAKSKLDIAQAEYDLLLTTEDAADVLEARASVVVTQERYDAAVERLNQFKAGEESLDVQAANDAVTQAEAGVAQAEATLHAAQIALDNATLTAPISGTVTALFVERGEIANSGQTIIILSDLSHLEAEVNLDETDISRIQVKIPVIVTVDAFPGVEISGELVKIALVPNVQSGVVLYPVTVSLDGTDLLLRSGMTINVTFPIEERKDTLIVPFRAVETDGGQAFVTRVTAAGSERVVVTLGLITDYQVEILSGLREGDVVAVYANPVQDTELMTNPMFGEGK